MSSEELIFLYDPPKKEWVRQKAGAFAGEIERLTPIVAVKRPEGQRVWCDEHHAYEKIKVWQEAGLTTEAGCQMRGPICEAACLKERLYDTERFSLPLRWRVSYLEEDGTVFIACDAAQIVFGESRDRSRKKLTPRPLIRGFRCEGISLRLSPMLLLPPKACENIPSPVADAALEFLLSDADRRFGSRPQLPKGLRDELFADGRKRLTAFLHWPFHMEFMYLLPYFRTRQGDLERLGHDPSDVFPMLCRQFDLNAAPELYEAYRERALALPIAAVLRKHGVRDYSLARHFFHLSAFLGEALIQPQGGDTLPVGDFMNYADSEYPREIFEDDAAMRLLCQDRWAHGFNASIFYCRWRLYMEGEEKLARHLLKLNEHWEPRYKSAFAMFYKYYPDIPPDIRDEILRGGFSVETQNRMIAAVNRTRLGLPDLTSEQGSERYECKMGVYSFRLIKSRTEGNVFLKKLCNSGWQFASFLQDDGAPCFAVYRGETPSAAVNIHGSSLRMAFNRRGTSLEQTLEHAATYVACLRWLKWTWLYQRFAPFVEESQIYIDEEAAAEPLAPADAGVSLHDLLHLPEEKITDGYYTQLHRLLLEARPYPFVVPEEETRGNESAYLWHLFPYGERIYRAAFAGNAEAQHVLSRCYCDGGAYNTLFMDKEQDASWIDNLLRNEKDEGKTFYQQRAAYWERRALESEAEKE